MAARKHFEERNAQQQIDKGQLKPKQVLNIIVELAFRVSNGTLPANMTRPQIRNWIRDNI